jgi:hypothetical protein
MTVNLDAAPVLSRTDAPQSLHCAERVDAKGDATQIPHFRQRRRAAEPPTSIARHTAQILRHTDLFTTRLQML